MKIKIINPDVNEGISTKIKQSAEQYANETTTLFCNSPASGPRSIDDAFTKEIASTYILEEILLSEQEGIYDGYVIACFADPAVHAAKEITNKPIIGIGEASVMLASFIGESFSIITVGEASRWVYKEVVRRTGTKHKLASLRSPHIQSEDAFIQPDNVTKVVIQEAKQAISEDFAEVIILGCGVMTGIETDVEEAVNVPVINPTAAGVKVLESIIGLGMKPSKAYSYKTPQQSELINVNNILSDRGEI